MPYKIQLGDIVAFSRGFIERHSQHTASVATAHGKVKALHSVEGATLADIEWSMPGLSKRVNVKNLLRVKAAVSAE
jgi:hypothetical protein